MHPSTSSPQGSFADSKPHYPLLDGLRGVAAIVVVWYHIFESFATSHLDQGVNHGYLAVDFFFLLSGFVLGYAYDGRWGKMNTWSFIRRRLIRLHPMVIFGAIFGGALFYTQGCEAWDVSKISIGMLLVGILLNALMIPAPTRMDVRGLGEIYPLNGPTWSLFFEYIGNLLYAIILRRLPLWGLHLIVLVSGLGLIGVAVYGTQGDLCLGWAFTPENALGGSLRLLFSMTMGLLLSRTLHTRTVRGSFALGAGLFVLLAVLPRLGGEEAFWLNGLYDSLCVLVLFPLLLVINVRSEGISPRMRQLCTTLGDLSYPLYMVHYPLLYCYYAWVKNHHLTFQQSLPGALGLLFGSILIAYLALRLYDGPVRRALAKRYL